MTSSIINRQPRDLWTTGRSQFIGQRALEYAKKRLAQPSKYPISEDLRWKLKDIAEKNLP